jgi:zeaxanthin epoxidase
VALLGDSAHAMQPNLGQGGCMAIEDAFQLGVDMAEAMDKASAHTYWHWLVLQLASVGDCLV